MGEIKKFTREEVSRNRGGSAPVWVIYKDSVYDVTSYLSEHPGGDVLLEEAGKDASSAFDDVGHSSDARQILYKFKIGEIVDEEKRYGPDGKKIKPVKTNVKPTNEEVQGRSCLSIVTCGLL